MGLSSNILWHQTNKDALFAILDSHSLRYAYSLETVIYKIKARLSFAYPMISICDLPVSEMQDYLGKYGGYSIGFTRDWANKNGFNPVWYCAKNSYPLKHLMAKAKKFLPTPEDENIEIKTLIYNELAHIKNVEGELLTKGFKNYRFYDEREYRLTITPTILKNEGIEVINPYLTTEQYYDYRKQHGNSLLDERLRVTFGTDDVYCLIVNNINDVADFEAKLQDSGFDKVKIFTNEEIKANFIGVGHNKRNK